MWDLPTSLLRAHQGGHWQPLRGSPGSNSCGGAPGLTTPRTAVPSVGCRCGCPAPPQRTGCCRRSQGRRRGRGGCPLPRQGHKRPARGRGARQRALPGPPACCGPALRMPPAPRPPASCHGAQGGGQPWPLPLPPWPHHLDPAPGLRLPPCFPWLAQPAEGGCPPLQRHVACPRHRCHGHQPSPGPCLMPSCRLSRVGTVLCLSGVA